MKRVFIVRPFGIKEGVNFDDIEKRLIQPALLRAELEGHTTTEIFESGNIREDMFRLLVTADLVIADLSIHNANVFYELGIRHGLRPRATVMLRADIDGHKYPFDLQTDRYLVYDHAKPAAKIDDLASALKDTVNSHRADSPVYLLLPNLKAPDPAVLKVVPRDFHEDVKSACDQELRGDLRLLAYEARGFEWESEGLRVVGRAQFNLEANQGAKETLEWLREINPDDIEANQRLATVYQRLGDLSLSDLAIQRVIDNSASNRKDLAEVFALRARNMKALWRRAFALGDEPVNRESALQAPELAKAQEAYAAAFSQDLNAYYPGVNALSLLSIQIGLAEALPTVWKDMYDKDEQAEIALNTAREQFEHLTGAVQLSLRASREFLERQPKPDQETRMWLEITEADFAFLASSRPKSVAQRYRSALTGASTFGISATRAQLKLFERLEVRSDFAEEALKVVRQFALPNDLVTQQPLSNVLLFTGHMVDELGHTPRFPNTAAAEAEARRMIRKAIESEKANATGKIIGVAGGACGGDILFHEICAELGMATKLYLALPKNDFCAASVHRGGHEWVERYNRLTERIQPRILSETKDPPHWLSGRKNYSIWQRNNLWMLFNALAENAKHLTLIALWNGEEGDGAGGTEDLVNQAKARGHKSVILDASRLTDYT